MKVVTVLATCAIFLCGCGGTAQTNSSANPSVASSSTPKVTISPIPDDIGLILRCNKCVFVEEKGVRYLAGQIHNDAKQAITGHVLAVDLQDAKGKSVKKIPGLMLMSAMVLEAGETKDFKDRVMSDETNVTQATVYFKKAGKEVSLSEPLTLKLNGPAVTSAPVKPKAAVRPTR